MTATVVERSGPGQISHPKKGTLPMAANTLILKGTIVCRDAAGRAVPGTDGSGFNAHGTASHTVDNRTGSLAGGAAGAVDIEIEYGANLWNFDGTQPLPGQKVHVLDNQTVTTDSDSSARGFAGICTEVRANNGGVLQAMVDMSPTIAGLGE